jgi:glutamate dehydrogenase/leucine dehydrogenase
LRSGLRAVGIHAARFLPNGSNAGCRCDSRGGIYNSRGLTWSISSVSVKATAAELLRQPGFTSAEFVVSTAYLDSSSPSGRSTEDNVGQIQARLVLQGANIPATQRRALMHEGISASDFVRMLADLRVS